MAAIIPAALILLKGIDYGWTAWDMAQAAWALGDPCSTQEDRFWAGLTIALAAGIETVEPDDLLPISLPLDDIVRRQLMHELREEGIESVAQRLRQELGDEAAEEALQRLTPLLGREVGDDFSKAGAIAAKGNGKGVIPYEVGTYSELTRKSLPGDGLSAHHTPQKAPAKSIIPGYSEPTAPSIALPYREHDQIYGPQRARNTTNWTARQLLADDIRMLRQYTNAPNTALRDLIELNKQMFPSMHRR